MLEFLEHNYSQWLQKHSLGPLPRHVRRAVEFIRYEAQSDLTLQDIVARSGVSARALQIGFNRFLSTTPMSYLRQVRLIRVREELLHPTLTTSVQAVALEWRFTHLGGFAAQYARTFGELPSVTLRLSRNETAANLQP